MTDEVKIFKLKEIKKYEENIKNLKSDSYYEALLSGFCVMVVVLGFVETDQVIQLVTSFTGGTCGMVFLRGMIESISEKTMLKRKVQDIKNELELAELEAQDRGGPTK